MRESIAERLKMAAEMRGLTQSQLAERLKTGSQPMVSNWMSGSKTPTSERIRELARALDIDEAWLAYGEGQGPQPDLEQARSSYDEYEWIFRELPPDMGRDYGNSNIWSLPWDVPTLVREALQNVNDATLNSDLGADVEFRLVRMRGRRLERFLEALHWESDGTPVSLGLEDHLSAAAQNEQKLSSIFRDGLAALEKNGELILLRIEDRGTRGLVGPETGSGNFAALARNNLDSSKESGVAGGSYGLGKAVFTLASRFATVLYHSDLSEPVKSGSGEKYQTGRVFGRSDLTYHEGAGKEFAGPGWFGQRKKLGPDKFRAESVWGNPALIDDLYLDRSEEIFSGSGVAGSGTTILVVGFQDPGTDENDSMDLGAIARRIAEAAADSFWPALYSGRLRVLVTAYEGDETTPQVRYDVRADDYQPDFVSMLQMYQQGELSDALSDEGDLVSHQVTLSVPELKSSVARGSIGETRHEALLLVKRESDANQDAEHVNEVAFLRGTGMIVRYQALKSLVLGGVPFRAIVLAGLAAEPDVSNEVAERFLRTAEPPAHDDWVLTRELKAEYRHGAGKRLDDFKRSVRERIRESIRPTYKDLEEGPRILKELLRIRGGQAMPTPQGQLRLYVDREDTYVDDEGCWNVTARIRLPDRQKRRVVPVLLFAEETGGGKAVNWNLKAIADCRVDGRSLVIDSRRGEAIFSGVSDPDSHPSPAGDSAVFVSLRNPEIID